MKPALPANSRGFGADQDRQPRGEIDRMNAVSREIRKLCGGTDKELVQLKRKYAGNSTIMQILNQFETGSEAAEAPAPKSTKKNRSG